MLFLIFLRGLAKEQSQTKKGFGVVIDSMDGLLPQSELEKRTSDAAKVAAGALMTSDFLKRVSLGMCKFGHYADYDFSDQSKGRY